MIERVRSLRKDLLTRVLCIIIPILTAVVAIHWYIERSLLLEFFDSLMKEKAIAIAAQSVIDEERINRKLGQANLPQFSTDSEDYFYQVWSSDGSIQKRSPTLGDEGLPETFGTPTSPESFQTVLANGREIRGIGIEFPLVANSTAGSSKTVRVVVAADDRVTNAVLLSGMIEVLVTAIGAGIAAWVIVSIALRHGMQVIKGMNEVVSDLEPDAAIVSVAPAEVAVEIKPIVVSLNESLATIRSQSERERRFNADVAHELRTPIAELLAAAEIADQVESEESQARLREHAKSIALQMGTTVENLLALSRVQSGAAEGDAHAFDLKSECQAQIDQFLKGDHGGRHIRLESPTSLIIVSFRPLWAIIVRNLLANALSYSPLDGEIKVSLSRHANAISLVIANPTEPTFDSKEIANFGNRFWTAARREESPQHSGLGLSIVEAACARLDYKLSLHWTMSIFSATVATAPLQQDQT